MKKIAMAITVVLFMCLAIGIMDVSAKEEVKPEEFYSGKLIDLSIQGSPGAVTDNVARAAAFFSRNISALELLNYFKVPRACPWVITSL